MIYLKLFYSENEDQKHHIRLFCEGSEEEEDVVSFADSITVSQLIIEVIGSEDDNIFVTKKGSSFVLEGEITTSIDVTSRQYRLLSSNSVYALR